MYTLKLSLLQGKDSLVQQKCVLQHATRSKVNSEIVFQNYLPREG